ncbi:MAG: hypothetical protein ACLQPH_05885 [Acidimicrobiales bacterium]
MTETTDDGTPISPATAKAQDELRAALRSQTELIEGVVATPRVDFSVEQFDDIARRIEEASSRYKMLLLADLLDHPPNEEQ